MHSFILNLTASDTYTITIIRDVSLQGQMYFLIKDFPVIEPEPAFNAAARIAQW